MSNEFKDLIGDFTEEQLANYELCMKYPILTPINDSEFQYEYTMLDFFPTGWRQAFGEQLAQEVQEAVDKLPSDLKSEACILGVKEKWNQLFVCLNVHSDELQAVLSKYEKLSEYICVKCGKHKVRKFGGRAMYLCDSCEQELQDKRKNSRS